jgi:hypothetical protein
VELVREPFGPSGWPPFVAALAAAYPRIRLETLPPSTRTIWWELVTHFRRARFYLRFFGRAYRRTPALLARARKRAPVEAVRLAERFGPPGRWLLAKALDVLEQSTPSVDPFRDYLIEHRPDLVVLTPLVVLRTTQFDLARAAMELGIRNVFAVGSWDHLSSKGELTFAPQRVLVWNEVQKQEAVHLHHLPADRIAITGSQIFDEWFDKQPSTTRDAFCHQLGLRSDHPFVLYVCSSLLEGNPEEPAFIMRWVRHLRESGHPVLRDCGILVRRHPERPEGWDGVNFSGFENVVCWPPLGESPVDERSKASYFDSMYHAAAVVGLNTSAMIEAAIVGRPVHTVLLPEFHDSQEGTLHFHYLLQGPHALLRAVRTLDDHARELAHTLERRNPDMDRSATFVGSFVRPCGAGLAATARVVEELEAIGAGPPPLPVAMPFRIRLLRPLVKPFLKRYADAAAERVRLAQEASRRRSEQRLLEHRRSKTPQLEEHRRQRIEEHRRRKQARDAARTT